VEKLHGLESNGIIDVELDRNIMALLRQLGMEPLRETVEAVGEK
jgi:hypothetical protein